MLGRTVLGLDLGSYSVKAVEMRAGLRGVEFVRCEEMVVPGSAAAEEREATIQLFIAQRGLPREFVVTSLSAERVTQRHLRFPFAGGRRLGPAISFEIEEDLPFPLSGMQLTHDEVLARPDQTDVLAILAPTPEIEAYLTSLRRLEVEPRILEITGCVLGNLSRYLELADSGKLLLDLGHQTTDLCLLVDGKPVLLRSIPIAGKHFTQALATDLKVTTEEAEQIKHEEGIQNRPGASARSPQLRALLDRLSRETLRSVQSATSDPLDPISPSEILLVGGSALLEGLPEFFRERTGMPCRVLTLPPGVPGGGALVREPLAIFAHAAALALRGSNTERVTRFDFRQNEFRYTPDLSGLSLQLQVAVALFGLMLVLWVASLGSSLMRTEGRAEALRAQLASVYSQTFPGEQLAGSAIDAMESQLHQARELANHLGVTGSGHSVLEVLREISARIPPGLDVTLTEIELERHSLRARGSTKDFVSVDRIRDQLSAVAFFDDVVTSDVVTDRRTGAKTFSISIRFSEDP